MSLPEEDVEFLDSYARHQGLASRSAVVHEAVRLLRSAQLGHAYDEAWREWGESGDGDLWERTVGDGLGH